MTTDKMIEQLTYFMEDSDPKTLELIVAKLREQEARLQAAEELASAAKVVVEAHGARVKPAIAVLADAYLGYERAGGE